jgi:hypothetical protein
MCGSTFSLTLALDGGGWLTPCPGHFTPGKEARYAFYRRLGCPQGWSERVRQISPPHRDSIQRPSNKLQSSAHLLLLQAAMAVVCED